MYRTIRSGRKRTLARDRTGTSGYASLLSARSLASILSIGSVGSILSIGSVLSIGSAGSILGIGAVGSSTDREEDKTDEQR